MEESTEKYNFTIAEQ